MTTCSRFTTEDRAALIRFAATLKLILLPTRSITAAQALRYRRLEASAPGLTPVSGPMYRP